MIVGVLAIQGSFKELLAMAIRQPGVEGITVRSADDLARAEALIIPGGESTTMGIGLEQAGFLEELRAFVKAGKPVWGVCAGMVMLAGGTVLLDSDAHKATHEQPLLGGLDIDVSRNFFGRQSASRLMRIEITPSLVENQLSDAVYFIRAPAALRTGSQVQVLARVPGNVKAPTGLTDSVAVAVRQGPLLATSFHPEISHDNSWMQYFLREVARLPAPSVASAPIPPQTGTAVSELLAAPWAALPQLSPEAGSRAGARSDAVRRAFMVFQQHGVIMDVVNAEQARVAEEAGAVAVMALERIPADIKRDGGIARSSDPALIKEIMNATTIPVMAKARIGHFAEAQILEALDVDCIDESEVLTPADEVFHIDKRPFTVPFVCGASNLGEALRRIAEGAAMIRLKGNAGTGNVMEAVRHARAVFSEIRALTTLREDEIFVRAKELQVPVDLLSQTRALGRLPVVTFAAGGIATPADVSLVMQLGCDGVFVGSGIFKGDNPGPRAAAMVTACTHFDNPEIVARVSEHLGKAMVGILDRGESYALARHADDKI